MCPNQLRELVVIPTLKKLDPVIPYSEEAVDLLMMTCAHESKMGKYIRQLGFCYGDLGGAFGIYQMETATEKDIYNNFLIYKPEIQALINEFHGHLMTDNEYATAMARLHYYREPEALPKKSNYTDIEVYLLSLARYCKKYYNTELGKAEVMDYYNDYKTFVLNE